MPKHPPIDESLLPAIQPPTLAEIVLDDRHLAYAKQRWPEASERLQAYRVRQAIWTTFATRKQHPDHPGRSAFGGFQPAINPNKITPRRIGQEILEEASRHMKEVRDAAMSVLDPKVDPVHRHKGAMNIAKLEQKEREMAIVEDEYARKTAEEVHADATALFVEMIRSGELTLEDIVDSTASDVDPDDQGDDLQQLSA